MSESTTKSSLTTLGGLQHVDIYFAALFGVALVLGWRRRRGFIWYRCWASG